MYAKHTICAPVWSHTRMSSPLSRSSSSEDNSLSTSVSPVRDILAQRGVHCANYHSPLQRVVDTPVQKREKGIQLHRPIRFDSHHIVLHVHSLRLPIHMHFSIEDNRVACRFPVLQSFKMSKPCVMPAKPQTLQTLQWYL